MGAIRQLGFDRRHTTSVATAGGATAGAVTMYLLDPVRGRRGRTVVSDKTDAELTKSTFRSAKSHGEPAPVPPCVTPGESGSTRREQVHASA